MREGICEGPGIVYVRFMSGQIQKLALELSRHLGALFVSITMIYKHFPREVDKYCHTARELKHRFKEFDRSHMGKLWKSKVQNLISWESLHSLIHKVILPCWANCSTIDLCHCRPLFQQEIHILGFAWTRLKKEVLVSEWQLDNKSIWSLGILWSASEKEYSGGNKSEACK